MIFCITPHAIINIIYVSRARRCIALYSLILIIREQYVIQFHYKLKFKVGFDT